MSAEAREASATDTARDEWRAAIRLAFGVTGCFVLVQALGLDASFLAPLIAAQMLAGSPTPPSLKDGIGLIVLIALSTGLVLVVTTVFIGHPAVLIIALSLILVLSFYAHFRGAPPMVTLLPQLSALTIPVIAVLTPDAAEGFAITLIKAGAVALATVWIAHGLLPSIRQSGRPGATSPVLADRQAARNAIVRTLILLPALCWFVLDASELAVVVLITIVTLLRQFDAGQSSKAAIGLILANVIGGIAAAIAYWLVMLRDDLLSLVIVFLTGSLIFSGLLVTAGPRKPLYATAFTTFILLLALGLVPTEEGSGAAFASRLINVLIASAYTIGALSLFQVRGSSAETALP